MNQTELIQFHNGMNCLVDDILEQNKHIEEPCLFVRPEESKADYFRQLYLFLLEGALSGFDIPIGILHAVAEVDNNKNK